VLLARPAAGAQGPGELDRQQGVAGARGNIAAMTTIPADSWSSRSAEAAANDRLVRAVLFLTTLMYMWLTPAPFPDLSDPKVLAPSADGHIISQVAAVLVTGMLAIFVYANRLHLAIKAVTPFLVLTFLWFACTAAVSAYPALAGRRLVLALFVIFQSTVLVLLPRDRSQFAGLLAAGALVVLTLCYAGVIFAPELSIHQASDIAEPQLAGNWRGFFAHKNGAGAGMAIVIIFGIYICRSLSGALGTLIIALATIFLFFTESKSPIMLLPLVLGFSWLLVRVRGPITKSMVAISVPAIVAVLTIGSVQFDAVNALVSNLLSDPTFTGRNDIWEFTLQHIAQRPVFGFGYQAFWGTSELVNNWSWLDSWGFRASDAHNGFLNIAVMTGIVGLLLALSWAFLQPLLDHIRTPPERVDPALNMMFIQLWLFFLYLSGFESELFTNGSIVWFMAAASIMGMRFQATMEYVREPA
jgi:O-antigen ligase